MFKFKDNSPIFIQVAEDIKSNIISGKLKSGDKVESVRTLAQYYSVNPNTIQKAMNLLEQEELIVVHRGIGRTISEKKNIQKYIQRYLKQQVSDFAKLMSSHNVDLNFVLDEIKEVWDDENNKR